MSLSLSFKPLPTLHACYSVPIEWTYSGNTTAQQGQIKLVFVSAQASSTTTAAASSRSTASTSSRVVSASSTTRASISTFTSSRQSTPTTSPSTTPIRTTLARRAPAPTPFTKTVTSVPISYTSIGWSPIALPSGTYDLAAYLVPGANGGKESMVGSQRGVKVIQGTDTGCLVAAGASKTVTMASTTSVGDVASSGTARNGGAVTDSSTTSSSNKGGLIGGIIGAVLGALIIAAFAYFLIRRRRRHHHQVLGTPRAWFPRRGKTQKKDRGVGSAFNYDFGTLGSVSAGTTGSGLRAGGGGMTQVSGPMDVSHVQGFQRPGFGAGRVPEDEDKGLEKGSAFGETYGMVPVLPRRNTDLSPGSEYIMPLSNTQGYRPPTDNMEFLASAPSQDSSFPGYTQASDQSHDYPTQSEHGRNPSESSYTTGQSHMGLLASSRTPIAFPSSDQPSETRRASVGSPVAFDPTSSIGRRSSGTPSTYQQRRKSSIATGGAVERSGSVRRKPVPTVEAYEDVPTPTMGGAGEVADAGATTGRGIVKQKSFVLDVERPLER